MAGKGSGKQHEKHQLVLANMLREEENKFCADCHAKGPRWASWNLGVFMCIRCAGIHRNLGVHISRVKSVNLDSWTPEQISTIQKGGNGKAREKYEANLPDNFRRPQDDYAVEQFIRSKYERKLYINKNQGTTAAKTTESRTESAKSNKKSSERATVTAHKKADQKKDKLLSVPRPPQTKRSTTPTPPPTMTPSLTPSPSAPAIAATMATTEPTVDLLTGMTSSPAQQTSPWEPSADQPSLGEDPQKAVKEGIMSLYHNTPPTASHQVPQAYTAHGYPVHAYHYQQQQMAAMRMAQQQQQQLHVRAVEEQMRNLKMRQGQAPSLSNGQPFMAPSFQAPATGFTQTGGQTLNPQLW